MSTAEYMISHDLWMEPTGASGEWVGKYKMMDIGSVDTSLYWQDFVDWSDEVSELVAWDSHSSVKISGIIVSDTDYWDMPIVGWVKRSDKHNQTYYVIRMNKATHDGDVQFYVQTYMTAEEFSVAMEQSETIFKTNTTLDNCQLYGELIANWIANEYHQESEDCYWHEDPKCDFTGDYGTEVREEVLDLHIFTELKDLIGWDANCDDIRFYWRHYAGGKPLSSLVSAMWLNIGSQPDLKAADAPKPAQVGGESINLTTYIPYKDKRPVVRVKVTKGELNSNCVEEVKCRKCMQTVIVSYDSVQKSRQSTKCPTCKVKGVHFG